MPVLFFVGTLTAIIGCAATVADQPPLQPVRPSFKSFESISPANANQLALLAAFPMEDAANVRGGYGEPLYLIGNAGIDAGKGEVAVLRLRRFDGKSTGIEMYDWTTGKVVRTHRVPMRADMTGKAIGADEWSYVDIANGNAWIDMTFPDIGTSQLIRVRLDADSPSKLTPGQRMTVFKAADIDSRRFMAILGIPWKHEGIGLFDRKSGVADRVLKLGNIGREHIHICGGVGEHVLARSWALDRNIEHDQLMVLEPDGPDLKVKRRIDLDGWYCARYDAIDWHSKLWIVCESDARTAKLSYNPDTRVRIYSIPSLELKAELPPKLFVLWRGMRTVPGRSLLLMVPDATPNQLVVVDTAQAKEIARVDLDAAKTGDVGGWVPFADPEGRYIGVYGSHWIQIFAVRPKE